MRTILLVCAALTISRCHSRDQLMDITNLSSWVHCSSICWCTSDNYSRTYGRCFVTHLDESVDFNLSRNLYSLSLANNGIRKIPSGVFSNFENLEILSLSNNSIETINAGALQGLKHLRILHGINPFTAGVLGGVLDLQFNNLRKWKGDPSNDIPSLQVLKVNGNKNWIPSQRILSLPMLKEVLGVTWSQHCFECDLIKTHVNEPLLFSDQEIGDEEDMGSGDIVSGEGDGDDNACHVTIKEFYFYPDEVKYGISSQFVKQGFSPQCLCDPHSDCYKNEVIITFLRQLYYLPRKLFLSQYGLGALIILLNVIVLAVILRSRILRKNVSFILVGSMSMSDLLIGAYCIAIAKYNLFSNLDEVILGVILDNDPKICSYIGMIFTTGQVTAVINSLLLTLERYIVIVHFQGCRGKINKRTTLVVLTFAWIGAVIFASLPLLGVERLKYHKWFQCTMPFHTGEGITQTTDVTLSISAIFVILYLISLGLYVLIFCYARKSSVQFGIKREARLARKIATLVSSNFILFTLPTVLLLVYVYSFSDVLLDMIKSFSSMRSFFIVGGWLPVTCFSLNSLVNPFLYPFRHKQFKKEMRSFHSRLRSGISNTFSPFAATAQQLSLRTSALSHNIRLHFHSFTARRDGQTSVRVELQLDGHCRRRASV